MTRANSDITATSCADALTGEFRVEPVGACAVSGAEHDRDDAARIDVAFRFVRPLGDHVLVNDPARANLTKTQHVLA